MLCLRNLSPAIWSEKGRVEMPFKIAYSFFVRENSPSLCVIECAKLIVIISRRRTMRKLISPPEGDDEAEKCV